MRAIGEQMRYDASGYGHGKISRITRIYPGKADACIGSAHDSAVLRGKKQAEDMVAAAGEQPVAQAVPAEKFALLIDLGIITVPKKMSLDLFFKRQAEYLYDHHKNITDANFSNPSRILRPGDKLRVRVFQQIGSGRTTSQERMAFLEKQRGNVYVGAQGIAHVLEQLHDRLPAGKGYASFDREERLWRDPEGNHRIPYVYVRSGDCFYFGLGVLESDGYDDDAFFSFSYVSN